MITSTESLRYLAKYTDKNGEIHKKEYATEAEAVYHLLHRLAKKSMESQTFKSLIASIAVSFSEESGIEKEPILGLIRL